MGRKEFISLVFFAHEVIFNGKLHFFSLHSDQKEPQYVKHVLL